MMRVIALAAAVLVTASACGGDDGDDDTAAAPTAAAEDTSHESHIEFCESVVAAETEVLKASSGGDPGGVEALLTRAEEAVPPELEAQMTVVGDAVREALETQSDRPFGSEDFSRNEEEIDRWVADNCGFERVDVVAVDYAFEGVPETIPAGHVAFTFSNEGEEVHEMLMVRYKDPSTTIEDLVKLSGRGAEKAVDFLGASFGPPGAFDTEPKELTPGKYALVCFVPVGSTSEKAARKADGPPHVARGMSSEFTVE